MPIQRKDPRPPLAESYATPSYYTQRKEVFVPPHMPGIIIFVHGVNSEGEWYGDAEQYILEGLNKRLGREDLKPREFLIKESRPDHDTSQTSPIIHFFWGYAAQARDERKWRVPLRDKTRNSAWAKGYTPKPPFYWGGGPFQNGCNNLPLLWSSQGFKRHVWAGFVPVDIQAKNPEVDRQLQDAPPRTYYAHAAGRLANLVRKIRAKYQTDTITLIGHSQGTQIVLATLALLEKENQPDCVMLMNGPYALESKVVDTLAQGDFAPTEKARLNTFENIVKRFDEGYRPLTDDLIAQLRVGATPERQRWTPKIPGERDNTGRLYVYFNPHDRVMGSTALQSMGWQGLPDSLLKAYPKTLFQRMVARCTPCGGEPGPAYLWPRELDGSLKPFWDSMKKTKGLIGLELWATPDPQRKVTINAEKVPEPVRAEEMEGFDELREGQEEWSKKDDFRFYRDIYEAEAWVEEKSTFPIEPSRWRLETEKEMETRIGAYVPEPTDHSTLPRNGEFLQRVVAYDLPIGFCQSHDDPEFWKELNRLADWRLSDMYYHRGELEIPPMPTLIDTETFDELRKQQEKTTAMWRNENSSSTRFA